MGKSKKREIIRLAKRRSNPRIGLGRTATVVTTVVSTIVGIAIGLSSRLVYMILFFAAFAIISYWIRMRIEKKIIDCNYFMCPWCRYVLTGLPSKGVCPECGSGYLMSNCRRLYKRAFESYGSREKVVLRAEMRLWARAIRERDRTREAC